MQTAIFGGGCFWCTEAVFKILRGVKTVIPGYAGGNVDNPTYHQVSAGVTGHAEVIKIEFDPTEISYENLLTVFFASHDPTTVNRQGNDVGTQYRSIILYTSEEQKSVAEKLIKELGAVTELKPFEKFYEAEDYHRDYYASNPGNQYCEIVINPKLEKVQAKFAELLKTHEIK